MSTQVEETSVSTEKPAIGRDAFTAARESLRAQSQDQEPVETPTPSDDTSTETPTEETEPVADQSQEPTSTEDTLLSADELAKLTPQERKQAEKWQAKLTQKAQALSARTKELEQWQPLIEGLTSDNPDAVIEELARRRGLTISKAAQDNAVAKQVQTSVNTYVEKLPAELRPLFQPAFEALANDVLTTLTGQIAPLAEAQNHLISEAVSKETEATLKAFEAKHKDFKTYEPQIVQLGQKLIPAPGTTEDEWLENLYTIVKSKVTKAEQVKETVQQINKSVAASEPRTSGVSGVRVVTERPANWNQMTSKERMRAAYEAAGRGEIWKD